MSTPDVVPVAWIEAVQRAYLQSGADRFGVVSNVRNHGDALHSQATVDALQARIDGLEKDARRMDWIEARVCAFDHISFGNYRMYSGHYPDAVKARQLIDAALTAEGK